MRGFKVTNTYVKNLDAESKERKHIILMDGTWNDETGLKGDGLVTNIVQLKRIFVNMPSEQIVRYHRGVGNDNDNEWVSQSLKGITGRTIEKIVDDAYARFVEDWEKGDEIYIFGFSRGAAAARMLATKISKLGVPEKIHISFMPRENSEIRVVEQMIHEYEIPRGRSLPVDVEFLGVWDTVSALGIKNVLLRFFGFKFKDMFKDHHIAPNIKKAVHLVAIDETRNPFIPSLMNYKENVTHEVWFPGVHSDIGGSYKEDSIAKASLHYMITHLKAWNAACNKKNFLLDERSLQSYTTEVVDEVHFHFHGADFGKNLRTIGVQVNGKFDKSKKPKIHRLYQEISTKQRSYSVVELRNNDGLKEVKYINFHYKAYNVEMLSGHYELVD